MIRFKCDYCGTITEHARRLTLLIDGQPVMNRDYCSACWPKTQFPVEAFVKRTAPEIIKPESGIIIP